MMKLIVWDFDGTLADSRPLIEAGMKHALAGHPSIPFEVPDGVSFVEIDRDTGKLAQPGCPRTYNEAFLAGTEPLEICELHRW